MFKIDESKDTTEKPFLADEEQKAKIQEEERIKIASLLYKNAPYLTRQYKALMGYTGGYLSASITAAYSKALSDALKFILKGVNLDENLKQTEKTEG